MGHFVTTLLLEVTFRAFVNIFRLFGLFPFAYKHAERRFYASGILFVYSFVYLVGYVYAVGYVKWNIYQHLSMESSHYNKFLITAALISLYCGVVTITAVAILYQRRFLRVFNGLIQLWYLIRDDGGVEPLLDRKLLFSFWFKFLIIDGGCVVGIAFFGIASGVRTSVISDTLYHVFTLSVNATFTNLFVIICYSGAHFYRVINVRIRAVYYKIEKVSAENIVKKRLIHRRLARELQRLSQWHAELNHLIYEFMDLHSPSLSIMVLKNFVILVGSLFGAYVSSVVEALMGNFANLRLVIFHLLMAGFFFMQFYYLVSSGALLAKRAEKTLAILGDFTGTNESDERLDDMIETFSLQLMHKNHKIQTKGMFVIDYSLIYAALATMMNYLIIAVQFQITSGEE